MTKKLYYSNPYLTEWQSKIVNTIEKDHKYFAALEETTFYPHGGGQPCDLGSIDGISVLDVFSEDDVVWHQVERLPEATTVNCHLDWSRRFDHMQQHTGQHLLSAMCLEHFQARTVSFHLGTDYVTIDVDKAEWSKEQLAFLEEEVNKQIYRNRNVTSYFVTNEEAEKLPLVKRPKVTENIRIVEIEGIEYNACGGTHVARTGEIGMIKLFKTEKQKENTRLFFKCGFRALQDFQASLHILDTLATKFNTGRIGILDRFTKWEMERKQLETELEDLKEKNNVYQAQELLANVEDQLLAHIFEDQKSMKEMQYLATKLATENDLLVLFASTTENKLVLAHSGKHPLSCGTFFKEHLASFNGKGGGSDKAAQAGFSSKDELIRFYHFVLEQVGEREQG